MGTLVCVGADACWESFLARWLRSHHQATLLLATKEWRGWPGRDHQLVAEIAVPPLTLEDSVILLQRLGLESVPTEYLRAVSERVAGIPLCLEWIAKLAHDPLLLDDWQGFASQEATGTENHLDGMTERVSRLLAHPTLLGEHLATRLTPLLWQIIEHHLSDAARCVLEYLSVVTIPLATPALQVLCPRPTLLKELRDVSLLAAYTNRVQLLPVVALTVQQHLTPEQRQQVEDVAIQAYTRWLDEGNVEMQEAGNVVTELTVLLLMHHRLLEAAELLIRLGWLSFQCGYGSRLALLTEQVMKQFDWQSSLEHWSGGTLLAHILPPFLGKGIDKQQRTIDYQAIRDLVCASKIKVRASTEVMLTHYIVLSALNEDRFVEAQQALELCCHRLEPLQSKHVSTRASVIGKHGMLLSHWAEYLEGQGEKQAAREKREQAIVIYQQFIHLLETHDEPSLLHRNSLKKQHAYALHYLGYHLYKIGHYEEALQALQQSIALQQQGYGGLRGLSPCYGDTILMLTALGRFQEALSLDEKAYVEGQRLVDLGHAFAKQEFWFNNVNRGCLYLRLGRIEEAEQLLREALPHITIDRRAYRMFAQEALDEIERWRRSSTLPQHQLDWRWVERYRSLVSYDTYWWLGSTGPLTKEEQREWDQLFPRQRDEDAKERLSKLMAQSTRREVHAALDERREPRLHYPTIDIEEVRSRISGLQQLDGEISREEPNAIVRRLYHDALEEELDTLRLIEATDEGNSEDFQSSMYRVIQPPTPEEMQYALSGVRREIIQGFSRPETKQANERLIQILHEQCGISFDLSYAEEETKELFTTGFSAPSQLEPEVTAHAAKRFFETVFQETGFDGWQVVIDPNATSARIEQGLRHLFLVNNPVSVKQIKHLLLHELAGHVMRCVAGEHSLLGLLGIHTKNSLETEEGLAIYYDIQEAMQQGEKPYETRLWSGTLATGLACGVITPAHTFRMLHTFLEALFFLRRRIRQLDADEETAWKRARNIAITRCQRTFRGVPDLTKAGICFTQDALYLRGLWKIERALKEDKNVLDRLAVGVVAVDDLPHLRELGIVRIPQPLRKLAEDPQLDSYILSFEQAREHKSQPNTRKEVEEP